MSRWKVEAEFVPVAGAILPGKDELEAIAASINEALSAHGGVANAGGLRVVAQVRFDAETESRARADGLILIDDAVHGAGLRDWRFDSMTAWPDA